jgi:hypothetical protein
VHRTVRMNSKKVYDRWASYEDRQCVNEYDFNGSAEIRPLATRGRLTDVATSQLSLYCTLKACYWRKTREGNLNNRNVPLDGGQQYTI